MFCSNALKYYKLHYINSCNNVKPLFRCFLHTCICYMFYNAYSFIIEQSMLSMRYLLKYMNVAAISVVSLFLLRKSR